VNATAVLPWARRRARGGNPHRSLAFDYADDLRLFPGPWARIGLVALAVLYVALPGFELMGEPGLRTMVSVGIFAIGAIGLNLLTGYTGQVSLGHAFFVGVGSYVAGYLGATEGWPLEVYLPAAALIGFLIGAAIGPFALRLRGNYLVIVTLGLLFVGRHVFDNWDSVTGGNRGLRLRDADMTLGPLDLNDLTLFGREYSRPAALFWLVWALVAVGALLAKNLVRSRSGRAMQAVRDRDLSAEVIGVHLARYKIGAFAWSSAFACVAGVLNGVLIRQVGPDNFGLLLSITYIAIIIIGGAGTILGSILGALFVIGGREIISQHSTSSFLDPLLTTGSGDSGWFTVGELNNLLFGVCIVGFLLLEPRGLVALWLRVKTWFRSWPFGY
jgi:branched-chain amino acid transport system permease protein